MHIRPINVNDIPAILAFWNAEIQAGVSTFSTDLHTRETIGALIDQRRAQNRGFFVAEQGGVVVGFATYDQFRGSIGYRHTMEHSICLAPSARRGGVGRALLRAVEDHVRAQGHHTMIAAISGENTGAIGFHAAQSYAETGRLREVGRKFDRWFDLVVMQKAL